MREDGSEPISQDRRSLARLTRVALAAVAALALLAMWAGSGARTSEAAGLDSGLGAPPIMADYFDPACAVFSTVGSYLDPFGYPVYQTLPIYGNPYTLFNQCVNVCAPYGFFGACIPSCPVALQVAPFGGLVCPGPPAAILFAPSPTAVTCGSASNLEIVVLDSNGLLVLDGTTVNFTTTLGYVSTQDGTIRGLATTSLTIPPRTAGQALITATSGNATAQKLVQVSC